MLTKKGFLTLKLVLFILFSSIDVIGKVANTGNKMRRMVKKRGTEASKIVKNEQNYNLDLAL
jgi:hypothetical protein